MEASTATTQKPSYLGLLNAISNAESAAGIYLEAWADVTPNPDLACTLRLVADKAVYKDTDDGVNVMLTAAPGKLATFRQKRDGGPDLWIEGEAQRIEYDERSSLVKLFGSAKIRQLEGTRMTDETQSEFISYDSRKEVFAVRNDASGENKPGKGRVTLILAPRKAQPAQPAQPAAQEKK